MVNWRMANKKINRFSHQSQCQNRKIYNFNQLTNKSKMKLLLRMFKETSGMSNGISKICQIMREVSFLNFDRKYLLLTVIFRFQKLNYCILATPTTSNPPPNTPYRTSATSLTVAPPDLKRLLSFIGLKIKSSYSPETYSSHQIVSYQIIFIFIY